MSYQALVTALKGGTGSGNWGHSGRPGAVGGSASSAVAIGSVMGNPMYRIEGLHIPDELVNKPAFFLVSPKGDLYIAPNNTSSIPRHDVMVDVLHDGRKYDYYTRAETFIDRDNSNTLSMRFGTYGAGIGTGGIDDRHDKIADKKFGKLIAQMLNSGYNPNMPVKWYTSEGVTVTSALEDWG